jgi:ketosteroid isomerase-like protein
MSTSENKQLMQNIFTEISEGNLDPFIDAMAEDMQWTWMGTEQWSHTFKGKESVVNELLAAVKETLTEPFEVEAHRFIAEGDYVVIEHTGKNTTPDGRPYNNKYCWVCRFSEGKLRELREYMDTELVTKTFGADDES